MKLNSFSLNLSIIWSLNFSRVSLYFLDLVKYLYKKIPPTATAIPIPIPIPIPVALKLPDAVAKPAKLPPTFTVTTPV